MPAIIRKFIRDEKHQCRIEALVANSKTVLEYVADGTVDIGIVSDPVYRKDLVVEPYFKDEVVLITPPHHRWSQGPPIPLSALQTEPFILREPGSGTRAILEAQLQTIGLTVDNLQVAMVLGGLEAVKAAVMDGLGVSLAPSIGIRRELETKRLAVARWADVEMVRDFNLVYAKGRPLPARMKAFLKCAREAVAGWIGGSEAASEGNG